MKTLLLLIVAFGLGVVVQGCAHPKSAETADSKVVVTIEGESRHVGRVLATLPHEGDEAPADLQADDEDDDYDDDWSEDDWSEDEEEDDARCGDHASSAKDLHAWGRHARGGRHHAR